MAAEIIPAILPKSFAGLEGNLSRVKGLVRTVQIDVCDGVFVPNTTWPYIERESFEKILQEEVGLPFWEDFDFEVDLMVGHAKKDALEWVKAGAARIIIHIESPDALPALEALQEFRIRDGGPGIEIAVAISLDTSTEKLQSIMTFVDEIQVMGIARIGFQGESFDERALSLVQKLSLQYPEQIVGVDGGVSLQTISRLQEAGARRLVVGSALFTGDVEVNFAALTDAAA